MRRILFNLNALDDEWPKVRKRLMDAAHYGNLAGATDIIFHPGSYFGNDPVEVLKLAIPRLQGCVEELRKPATRSHCALRQWENLPCSVRLRIHWR